MKDKIVEAIVYALGVSPEAVKDDTTLEDLNADDLDNAVLAITLEKDFDIVLGEDDWPIEGVNGSITVKQIRELVNSKLEAKKQKEACS